MSGAIPRPHFQQNQRLRNSSVGKGKKKKREGAGGMSRRAKLEGALGLVKMRKVFDGYCRRVSKEVRETCGTRAERNDHRSVLKRKEGNALGKKESPPAICCYLGLGHGCV